MGNKIIKRPLINNKEISVIDCFENEKRLICDRGRRLLIDIDALSDVLFNNAEPVVMKLEQFFSRIPISSGNYAETMVYVFIPEKDDPKKYETVVVCYAMFFGSFGQTKILKDNLVVAL